DARLWQPARLVGALVAPGIRDAAVPQHRAQLPAVGRTVRTDDAQRRIEHARWVHSSLAARRSGPASLARRPPVRRPAAGLAHCAVDPTPRRTWPARGRPRRPPDRRAAPGATARARRARCAPNARVGRAETANASA